MSGSFRDSFMSQFLFPLPQKTMGLTHHGIRMTSEEAEGYSIMSVMSIDKRRGIILNSVKLSSQELLPKRVE